MSSIEVARQLIAAMHSDPEVAAEVRRAVLSEDLLALPEIVRQLAEAQARTEARVEQLAVRMGELAVRMDELAVRMDELAVRMDELAARVEQLTVRMDELAVRMDQLAARMEELAAAQTRTANDVADLKGKYLEMSLRMEPRRYVPRSLAGKVRRMSDERYEEVLGVLDANDAAEVERADALVDAEVAGEPVVLIVETSWVAHVDDVERAQRRAHLLQNAGIDAAGVVISHGDPAPQVLARAKDMSVAVVSESHGLLVPERPTAA
jgi:chromosome segregation ATPase